MSKVTSVRLSDELADQVNRLANALDRPKAWVIEQAVARYVEQEAWQVQAIAEAVAEYRADVLAGHVEATDHAEFMDELAARVGDERSR